ncbi:MAG: adenylate kinase [Chloroflexi bacterium]|nr:adenylate kinase [Chloroflexota bacterium]
MRVVILGLIGAGKGTQALRVASGRGIVHISTGDMFRAQAARGTELGLRARAHMERGELVPDEVTIGMLLDRISEPDAEAGFILDGFPRTAAQAEALERALAGRGLGVDVVPRIEVPQEVLLARIAKRAQLEGRSDDRPEVVAERLRAQRAGLEDVARFYEARRVLVDVDGVGSVDEVADRLAGALERVSPRMETA